MGRAWSVTQLSVRRESKCSANTDRIELATDVFLVDEADLPGRVL